VEKLSGGPVLVSVYRYHVSPSPLAGQGLLQLTLSKQNLLLNGVLCQGEKSWEGSACAVEKMRAGAE
jgi:hypothetical protein